MINSYSFGTGKPIILVHGWAMHSGVWLDFAQALARRHRVICLDLPAHGQSADIESFDLQSISAALVNAVDEENACWLGWSLGAAVVLEIARRFPKRVDSLILLAGNPQFVAASDWAGMQRETFQAFVAAVQADSKTALARFLALQVNQTAPDARQILKHLKTTAATPPDDATLQAGLAILAHSDLRATFAALTVPVSVILGSHDNLVPAAVGAQLQALRDDLQLHILDGAGHTPFLSHPAQVITIIEDFLETP